MTSTRDLGRTLNAMDRFPLGSGIPDRNLRGRRLVGKSRRWSRDLWGGLLRDWSVAQWMLNRVGDLV